MAINFPDSPSNGDTFTANGIVYTYNASTTLWDTTSAAGSAIDLSAVNEAIIPNTNETYDLGSSTHKWKDLYLSGSTLHLGASATISAGAGSEIVLPSIKVGAGSNAVKLSASATGGLQTQAVVGGVSQPVQPAGGTVQVADLAAMQAIASPAIGNMVSVVANKTIYMYNGTGFYKIATMVNESPSAITGVNGAYTLATDGTATTITAISTDPEGRTLSWSYAVTTGSLTNGGGVTATVVQGPGDSTGPDTNVFTITPTTNSAYTGSFSITFSVTDNVNGAVNAVSAFTLAFTPPLPTSGLLALYDMNDTNSYSGSGSTWSDVSGNSGPDLTIDTSVVTYNSSGIGSISSLSLDTNTSTPAVTSTSGNGGLTNSASPYSSTVIMIFSPSSNTPTWGYMFASAYSQGVALKFETSSSSALQTGTAFSGSWQHNAARPTSKFYIDKVDETSMTQQEFKDFLRNTNNQNKYHSFVLTDGHFLYGWATNNHHANLPQAALKGDIRALVFYDRVLTSSEIDDVHNHFAGDYTSSEMA